MVLGRQNARQDRSVIGCRVDRSNIERRDSRAHSDTAPRHCARLLFITGILVAAMPSLHHLTMVHRHRRHSHIRLHQQRCNQKGDSSQDKVKPAKHLGTHLGSRGAGVNFLVCTWTMRKVAPASNLRSHARGVTIGQLTSSSVVG